MRNLNNLFRATISVFVMLVLAQGLKAQQVPLFNQYFNNGFLQYPSVAGFADQPRLSLIYRGQFSGLEGAPSTFAASYSSLLGKQMGFGVNVQNTEIGLVRQTKVAGGFAWKFWSSTKHQLSVGALPTLSFFSINEDRVSPETFDDQVLQSLLGNNGTALSVDLSVSYRYGDFGLDFAVPTVINESLTDDAYIQINEDNIPDFIAGAHYRFMIDPIKNISVTPNVTWRYRDVIGSELDALVMLEYGDKFSVSGGYRNNYGPTAGVGVKINRNIQFSYHYDFGQSDVPFLSDGFSEIGLHFNFKRNEEKWRIRYMKGDSVIQRLRNEGIYDQSLISEEEKRLATDYLYSLESTGSNKEKRAKAEENFQGILDEIREVQVAKLAEEARQRKEAEAAKAEADRIAAEQEAERQRVEAERVAEEQRKEAERIAEEQRKEAGEEEKATETERVSQRQGTEEDKEETLERDPSRDSGYLQDINSIGYEYVIVIASYNINSPYAKSYLDQIKSQYPDAAIFRSVKRSLDYLYVGGYDQLEPALQRMREIRANSEFKDSWVHIIRLSR